jgi:tetratricopeptide (TPR) repeat protein
VAQSLPAGRGTVVAVAIGPESDLQMLGAVARGGGGVVLPHVPGQTTAEAAFAVLGSAYGSALRDVTLTLPEALHEVAPRKLDTILAGQQAFVVARLAGAGASGTIVLRGKLGTRDFEQRYPVQITPSSAAGNAFVPRLYAALRIADLERDDAPEAKRQAIALSGRFSVASRHTSLLVLESPAMFRAFGLDNTRTTPEWTGEEASEGTSADGEIALAGPGIGEASGGKASAGGGFGTGMGGLGTAGPGTMAKREAPMTGKRDFADDSLDRMLMPAAKEPTRRSKAAEAPGGARVADPAASESRAAAPAPLMEVAPPAPPQAAPPVASTPPLPRPPIRPGRTRQMIPMRRIWERVGLVSIGRLEPRGAGRTTIANLESRLSADENRRDLVKRLYTLHMLADDVEQAADAAERWAGKAPLDPEALRARADVAARRGDREGAIRMLGSVVEVRPEDVKAQGRLARLWRWAGRPELGCRPLQALAELHPGDAARVADAVRCARAAGQYELADDLLAAAEPKAAGAIRALLDRPERDDDGLRGDLRVEAAWSGGDDLDLAILDPRGQRVSWFGGPTRATVSARDAVSPGREAIALRGAGAGEYVIEIGRLVGDDDAGRIVRGELTVSVAGARQRVPFTLRGQHARVALASITLVPRLVPLGPTPIPRPLQRAR